MSFHNSQKEFEMLDYLYGTKSELTFVMIFVVCIPTFLTGLLSLGIGYDKSKLSSPPADEVRFAGWFGIYSLGVWVFSALVTPWVAVAIVAGCILYYIGQAVLSWFKNVPTELGSIKRFLSLVFSKDTSSRSSSSISSNK